MPANLTLPYHKAEAACRRATRPDEELRCLRLLHEFCPLPFPEYPISAERGTGREELPATIHTALDVVRVYTRLPTKKDPDYDQPFTVRRGGTLLVVAGLVPWGFAQHLKFARVWGTRLHPGTTVKGDHLLHDRDVVELHV